MTRAAKFRSMIRAALTLAATGLARGVVAQEGVGERQVQVEARRPALMPAPIVRDARVVRTISVAVEGASLTITLESPGPPVPKGEGALDEEEDAPPERPIGRFLLAQSVLERENFDRLLFGRGSTEDLESKHLDQALRGRLDQVAWQYRLTDEQRAKLHLAGRGDIKRFLERVEASRERFESARKNFQQGLQFLRQANPLAKEYRDGPFGVDSLFEKTLRTIRDDPKGPM